MTKTERLLREVERRGAQGMTKGEMMRYVAVDLSGKDWEERRPDGRRRWSSYWSDCLSG